jgi:hypothetical protein
MLLIYTGIKVLVVQTSAHRANHSNNARKLSGKVIYSCDCACH